MCEGGGGGGDWGVCVCVRGEGGGGPGRRRGWGVRLSLWREGGLQCASSCLVALKGIVELS